MKRFIKVKAKLTFEVEDTLDGYLNNNEVIEHFKRNYEDYLDHLDTPEVDYEVIDDWDENEPFDDLTPYDDFRDNYLEYMEYLKENGDE